MLTVKDMARRGWTRTALAKALQVDPSTIYRQMGKETKLFRLALARLDETETPAQYHVAGPLLTYFIRCGDTVKIGCSRDVAARLATLQISNAAPLQLLGVTPESESTLHRQFAEHRLHGEWFRLAPAIEAYCAALT